MKNTYGLLLILLILTSITTAFPYDLASSIPDTANIRIDSLRYDPYPVEPGKYFKVWIKTENFGNENAENFTLEVVDTYPFTLKPSQERIRNIGILGSLDQAVLEFEIFTDRSAIAGDNELTIRFTSNGDVWTKKDLTILVQSPDAILAVQEVMNPELSAGEEGFLRLKFKNLAKTYLKNIKVSLDIENYVVGTSIVEFPFSIIDSGKTKTIETLAPGETTNLEFSIKAENAALSDIYKVPMSINYMDELDVEYSLSEMISVLVMSDPNLEVILDSSSISAESETGSIVFKIINKGFGEVKFLTLDVEETDEFEIISQSSSEYVGNLESDDFDTAEFEIFLKSQSNKINIPVQISYWDDNNELKQFKDYVDLKVFSSDKLNGVKSNNLNYFLIIGLIVIISGVVYFRRKRKKA